MRALTALVAVVSLGVIVYWGTSAGEVPTLDLTEVTASGEQVDETAVDAGDAYPGEDSEAGVQSLLEISGVESIKELADSISLPQITISNSAQQVNGDVCWPVIANPDFEGRFGWDLPVTEYPAVYSEEQALSPVSSVRTGIVDPMDNTVSYSSVSQLVSIPANVTGITLTFNLYTQTSESANLAVPEDMAAARSAMTAMSRNVGDAQWVFILNRRGDIIERLVSMRTNDPNWTAYQFTLDPAMYAGKTIRIYFASFNNGWDGVTAMYVDDVQLELCGPEAPPPTNTPTPSPTATSTPTPTNTATPTNTPEPSPTPTNTPTATPLPPLECEEIIINGGFELTDEGWMIPITEYTAEVTDENPFEGTYSLRTGILDEDENTWSYSSGMQKVMIPGDATRANLSFYLYPQTSDPANMLIPNSILEAMGSRYSYNMGDAQWVFVLDQRLTELERLVSMRSNSQTWERYGDFDLLDYKGRTIVLYFGTFNNGGQGVTSMFVDNVSLEICTGFAPPEETAYLPVIMSGWSALGISGTIGDDLEEPVAGQTVQLLQEGAVLAETTTDEFGSYSFASLPDGTYTVAPLANGLTFTPVEIEVTLPPSAEEVNFVANPAEYP